MAPDELWAAVNARVVDAGITFREAARQAGIYPSTLSRLKAGRTIDMQNYTKLLAWLGVKAELPCVHDWGFAYGNVWDGNHYYCTRCLAQRRLAAAQLTEAAQP